MAEVGTLRIAPVKGLRTVRCERLNFDVGGVAADRRLFLVDSDTAVVTLRERPGLVAAVPSLDLAEGELRLDLPDGSRASADLGHLGEPVRTRLFGKERSGRVVDGDASTALSELAGEPLRLVLADGPGVGWDEGPVSLVGTSSVSAVGSPGGDADRYRMLVELTGTAPFEEDGWVGRQLQAGEAVLRVTQQLGRCVVITRHPRSGERDWEGLEALAAARGRDQLCLGVIAEVVRPGDVALGDEVRPLA